MCENSYSFDYSYNDYIKICNDFILINKDLFHKYLLTIKNPLIVENIIKINNELSKYINQDLLTTEKIKKYYFNDSNNNQLEMILNEYDDQSKIFGILITSLTKEFILQKIKKGSDIFEILLQIYNSNEVSKNIIYGSIYRNIQIKTIEKIHNLITDILNDAEFKKILTNDNKICNNMKKIIQNYFITDRQNNYVNILTKILIKNT